MLRSMWKDDDFGLTLVDAIKSGGGLLCMWDRNFLKEESIHKGYHLICIVSEV